MPVEIVWYGERGIINALVVALRQSGVEAVKKLLTLVTWANGGRPEWIAHVTDAKLIVEVGLSQFGDPDLIVVCKTDDRTTYVVFLEAKIAGYADSAMSIAAGIRKNFNSSVNGQLSLKYRFAHAVSRWNGGPHALSEPQEVADAYQQAPGDGGLGDPQQTPRRLAKPAVLQILRENGLAGLHLAGFHFVVLTGDGETIFTPEFGGSELRPLFLDDVGGESWGDIARDGRVGWLGYSTIAESAEFRPFLGADYRQAVDTMIRPPPAEALRQDQAQRFQPIRTNSIEKKSKRQTKDTLNAIEAVAKERFGDRSVERGPGSISIMPFDRVLVKLVPRYRRSDDECLLLGIAASLGRQDRRETPYTEFYRIGVGPNARDFCMMELPPQIDRAVEIADGVFEILAEMLELDREGPEI